MTGKAQGRHLSDEDDFEKRSRLLNESDKTAVGVSSSQHWVAQQNTLEMPGDKDEVNAREIHKCFG